MSMPTPTIVRVNQVEYAWTSAAFRVDGMLTDGITGVDYGDSLETRTIPSNVQDAAPLGMSAGRYQIAKFPLRMLRSQARALKDYLFLKAPTQGVTSYGQATWDFSVQLLGSDAPNNLGSTTTFATCRIVGEKSALEGGTGAAMTEFQVACLGIEQDGSVLWNALPASINGLPAVDSITVAGSMAPGKWTLLRAPRRFGWDIRAGYAFSGATVVPKGDELVVARFLVEIWTPQDYAAFQVFRSQYLKKALVAVPGATLAQAFGIDHPELKSLGCTSVVPQEDNPLLNDGFGVYACEVEFLQYRPPVPALSKPNAAIPDVTTPTPTAQTQTEVDLQQASAELQSLPGAQ